MEDWQIRHIDLHIEKLKQMIVVDAMLKAALHEVNLINVSEDSKLDALHMTKSDVSATLLNLLKTKKDGYWLLIDCLRKCNQTGAMDLLDLKQLNPFSCKYNNNFHGRKKELHELLEFAKREYNNEKFARYDTVTIISGMGGVGKTELCKRCVETWLLQNELMNAVLLNGDSEKHIEDSLRTSYTKLCKKMQINLSDNESEILKKDINIVIKDLLLLLKGCHIVFIFDNIDKPEIVTSETGLFVKFFDKSFEILEEKKPRYLITSRYDNWDQQLKAEVTFPLGNMRMKEATLWVSSALHDKVKHSKMLVKKLDRYTLAIQQAVSLIKQKRVTEKNYKITEYMSDLDAVDKKLTYLKSEVSDSYTRTTFDTFITSIEYLLTQANGNQAYKYLAICAYLNPDHIEVSMLSLNTDDKDIEAIKQALILLKSCSLLSLAKHNVYKIHRVFQTVLRLYFSKGKSTFEQMFSCLNANDMTDERTIVNRFSDEPSILMYSLELLDVRRNSAVHHAAHVWRTAAEYPCITKNFYRKSSYGILLLSPLHVMVDENDKGGVQKILKTMKESFSQKEFKKLLNKTDKCARTSAFLASSRGYCDLLEMFQQENADFSIRSTLCFNYFEKLQLLAYESTHFEALHIAAYNNQIEAVKLLRDLDISLDKVVSDTNYKIYKTSYIAGMVGNLEMVQNIWPDDFVAQAMAIAVRYTKDSDSLLANFQNLFVGIDCQRFAQICGSKVSNWGGLFEFIVSKNPPTLVLDWFFERGHTLEHASQATLFNHAAKGNSLDAFIWLVRKFLKIQCGKNGCEESRCKGDCRVSINWGCTPLFEAARYGSIEVANFILENNGKHGINGLNIPIDIQDGKGDTPLYQAAYWGHLNMVKFLIERGANINHTNKWGCTPIIAASLQAKFEVVVYMAQCKNIVFQPARLGKSQISLLGLLNMTVLHAAIAHDSVKMTELLIRIFETKEAILMRNLRTNGRKTITLLHTAVAFDSPNVITFLKKKYNDDVWQSQKLDLIELIEKFLKLAENKNFNLPPKTVSRAKYLIPFVRYILYVFGSSVSVTPYQAAVLLDHPKCAEQFDVEHRERMNSLTFMILKNYVFPTIKTHLSQMKQYLSLHGGKKEPVGGDVTELVSKTLLNW